MRKSKKARFFAVVNECKPVAQSWNGQYCIYETLEAARLSIKEFHTKRPGEKVVEAEIKFLWTTQK